MTTAYTTDAGRSYLDRVRDLLSDLPEEERAELIQDLAAHLDELEAEDIESTLGTPEAFVAEFRAMAGIEEAGHRRPGMLERAGRRMGAWRNHPTVVGLEEHWPGVRPVWVGVRGWLLTALVAVLGGGTAFRSFPIPELQASTAVGLLAVIAATIASLVIARRALSQHRGWRTANAGFNVIVLWLLLLSLFNGNLYTLNGLYSETIQAEQRVRDDVNALLPRDLTATTPDGRRLDGVLLYDEEGRPFDLAFIRWQLGLDWPYDGDPGVEPDENQPSNGYPIGRSSVTREGADSDIPASIQLPDLMGVGVEEARSIIESLGLALAVADARIEAQDAGLWDKVADQDPEPGTVLEPGETVTVTLGTAPPETTTAPPDATTTTIGSEQSQGGQPEGASGG